MELAFAGMVVSIVWMFALGCGVRLMRAAQALDAISIAWATQTDAIVHYTVHGRWPSPGDPGIAVEARGGAYASHLALGAQGLVTAELPRGLVPMGVWGADDRPRQGARGVLSFRPELLGSADAPGFAYLCGYARPTPGAVAVTAAQATTLPPDHLPPFCR